MKILLVEDTASLRNTIAEALREDGYLVETAADGAEAFRKIEISDYDAVILDIVLPDYDGFTILRSMRESNQTPVIVLTARDAVNDRIKGLDLGADDYLTKPFDLNELLARLRAVTRRGYGDRLPTIQIGKTCLNTATRIATYDGVQVDLTTLEYSILESLVRQRGEIVSRNFLYDHLYTEDESTLSNVLDVYIYRLRSKFGKDFIKTKRGYGYIIEES